MAVEASPIVPTLPGRYYADSALYAAEQQRIFGRLWTCIGLAQQLAEPGDYCTYAGTTSSFVHPASRSSSSAGKTDSSARSLTSADTAAPGCAPSPAGDWNRA